MKMSYLLFICVFLNAPVFAQKSTLSSPTCNCSAAPPYPTKSCAETCIKKILTGSTASTISNTFDIASSTAHKIVSKRESITINTVEDLKAILSSDEFEKLKSSIEKIMKESGE